MHDDAKSALAGFMAGCLCCLGICMVLAICIGQEVSTTPRNSVTQTCKVVSHFTEAPILMCEGECVKHKGLTLCFPKGGDAGVERGTP